MGLDSRDYMHEDDDAMPHEARGRASAGGWRSATGALLLVNLVVFVLWQVSPPLAGGVEDGTVARHFTLSVAGLVQERRWWTLLTHAVSHAALVHLVWDLLFLRLLARDVEREHGAAGLLLRAGAGVLAGGAAWLGVASQQGLKAVPALGASAVVLALAAAVLLRAPRREVPLLGGLIPAPLWLLLVIYALVDGLLVGRGVTVAHPSGLAPVEVGGAPLVLLAGAAAGAVVHLVARALGGAAAPRLRVLDGGAGRGPAAVAAARPTPPAAANAPAEAAAGGVDPAMAEKVDDLLRKIHEHGIDSLSADEKKFLEQASSRYKR